MNVFFHENLSLSGLEARVGFVDDVQAALAADDTAILVARFRGFERFQHFHGLTFPTFGALRRARSGPRSGGHYAAGADVSIAGEWAL